MFFMDKGQIVLYQTQGGEPKIEVRIADETVWLTADQMAELFQRDKSTISRHIKNVLESGELMGESVVAENATTARDGKTYIVAHYNLDMIISVGYRVNSHRGVQFRIWATKVLKEYMIKVFALNDELLKWRNLRPMLNTTVSASVPTVSSRRLRCASLRRSRRSVKKSRGNNEGYKANFKFKS